MIHRTGNQGVGGPQIKAPQGVHPGKITMVNADDGTSKVLEASQVPEAVRFVNTPEGRLPIVRIVSSTSGDKRTIQEYGTEGQMLRSTVQTRR
jgi:hypothetical protein